MPRPDKAAAVTELAEAFRTSSAAVITEYRGLTVGQLRDLRRSLDANADFAVVKNTLTRIAARDAGVADVEALLEGPSAIAFVKGDPVEAAKGLRDFARANPLLVIKGGVLDGKTMSSAEIGRLADVEPREVLLARLAGAMTASLSSAASLFQAPLSQAARVLEALRQQQAEGADAAVPAPVEDAATEPAGDSVTEPAGDSVTEPVGDPAAEPVGAAG